MVQRLFKALRAKFQLRRLTPIEIAEGALLADVAIILQLLGVYLPYFGLVFLLLIPSVFAVLVLRRGFYPGVLSFFVSLFIVGILTGTNFLILLFWESGAGLLLGLTMKKRLSHGWTFVITISAGSIVGYIFSLFFLFLSGLNLTQLTQQMNDSFKAISAALDWLATYLGWQASWQHNFQPGLTSFFKVFSEHWLIFLFLQTVITLIPTINIVYLVTNFIVRLLGYDVIPYQIFSNQNTWRSYQKLRKRWGKLPKFGKKGPSSENDDSSDLAQAG